MGWPKGRPRKRAAPVSAPPSVFMPQVEAKRAVLPVASIRDPAQRAIKAIQRILVRLEQARAKVVALEQSVEQMRASLVDAAPKFTMPPELQAMMRQAAQAEGEPAAEPIDLAPGDGQGPGRWV